MTACGARVIGEVVVGRGVDVEDVEEENEDIG